MPFSHHQKKRIVSNTFNPSLSTGKDLLIHSLRKIDDERMSVFHQVSGKTIPSACKISLDPRVGDGFPNTSLVLVKHGHDTAKLAKLGRCSSRAKI